MYNNVVETHRQTQISLFDGLMVKKDGCLLYTYHFVRRDEKGGICVIPLRKIRFKEEKARDFFIVYRSLHHNRNSSGHYIACAVPRR